ncbi:MAG TPA: ATP-binding protein [Pyrinomonadaceae bacterium]|nr:ATP-binding protein [Pyrinomonadaceae bacterium]
MTDEFEARFSQISASIDQLRASAGKNRRELLDKLFRNVHSLKAAAHANGLNDLAARAHQFEDLLHAIRTGRASFDDLTDFDHAQNTPIQNVIPAEISSSLKDEERHRLAQCIAENANVYLVEESFDLADFDQKFQQKKEELNSVGEVIATFPKADGRKINFRIVYATTSDVYAMLHRAMRAGQAVADATGKSIDFSITVTASLEKSVCDALADPVIHLVRNAVDHGIETSGHIVIEASETRITVTDDGRGIDPGILDAIFEPGFSTANVSDFSGRGVGLDVVKNAVEELGGSIRVFSEPGKGSTFEITL